MASKRKTDLAPGEESDLLTIRPLGAGQEVGRSCIMLEFKGKQFVKEIKNAGFLMNFAILFSERKIMLDCGIHPGLSGMDALPFVDLIEADEIDLLFISQ